MFVEHGARGYDALLVEVLKSCEDIAQDRDIRLRVDAGILMDAYEGMCSTIAWHGMPIQEISHFRELAHVAYWISELKPVQIREPISSDYFVRTSFSIFRDLTGTSPVILENAPRETKPATDNFSSHVQAAFPINEYVALRTLTVGCQAEFMRSCGAQTNAQRRKSMDQQNAYFQSKMYPSLFGDLILALRYHVFTPRSFAALIDSVYRFEGQ
jgi:hypothetical protein